jgi:heptose I phosphotransferase
VPFRSPTPNAPDAGTFRVHPAFAALLARHGLADCETLFGIEAGTPLRRLKTRENWRVDLSDEAGRITTLYLKKHHVRTLASRFRAWLGFRAPATPARAEAERTEQLAALGIPTMTVAAYAERLRPEGTLVAAFLTEELTGFEQLDLFLPRRFAGRDDAALRQLIGQVADLAGRFHRLGFNHRDLYTCHFFVKEENQAIENGRRGSLSLSTLDSRLSTPFAVHLIDLQRVQRWPAWLRRRWVIKDLAQLAYSCPPRLIGATERMRFFKRYLGIARLDVAAKRLARAVLTREAALARRHGPYRDWDAELRPFSSKAA